MQGCVRTGVPDTIKWTFSKDLILPHKIVDYDVRCPEEVQDIRPHLESTHISPGRATGDLELKEVKCESLSHIYVS